MWWLYQGRSILVKDFLRDLILNSYVRSQPLAFASDRQPLYKVAAPASAKLYAVLTRLEKYVLRIATLIEKFAGFAMV